jgi:hypothetical protein
MIVTLLAGQLTTSPEQRKTKDGRTMVSASLKARLGRENVEGWQVIAYNHVAQQALLRLRAGEFLSLQGVPNIRTARVGGEPVLQRVLFIETVMALRTDGGDNAAIS